MQGLKLTIGVSLSLPAVGLSLCLVSVPVDSIWIENMDSLMDDNRTMDTVAPLAGDCSEFKS